MTGPRILTVRQPWAWAIIHAGKDVENRTWSTSYRGPLLIHAGLGFDGWALDALRQLGVSPPPEMRTAAASRAVSGRIIGMITLTDCFLRWPSRWAEPDCWHWVLADPVPAVRPLAVRGRFGLAHAPQGWQDAFDTIKEQP